VSELAGRRRLGEGREAEVYAWGEGAVLRLLRDPRDRAALEREAAALAAASTAGAPVPAPGELVEVEGRPGLVMERVDGADMFTLLGRRPWLVGGFARRLGALQAELHAAPAPAALPSLRHRVAERIAGSGSVAPALAERALAALEGLPDGEALCHGDLHPGNVLMTEDGPRIIDWTNATRGDPMADVAYTSLLFEIAVPQPSAPFLVRRLDGLARDHMRRRHLTGYAERAPVDRERAARWRPMLAVVRLAMPLPREHPALHRIVEECGL
jgi:aminoglycoside phosphotransferase (APT) family kinase protein